MSPFCVLQLDEAPTTGDFRSLLSSDEYSFRFDCGVAQPAQNMTIKDKDRVISAIVIHYALSVCKAEIDQLLNGLETLKVLVYFCYTILPVYYFNAYKFIETVCKLINVVLLSINRFLN